MTKITNSIVNLIGNTPIVKLNRVVPEDAADVYVKLEFFNPGGSIKDRIALAMVEEAEKAGKLQAGGTLSTYSVASTIPSSLIPNEASCSPKQGESTTLQIRVVPLPFFNRKRV